MRNIIERKFRDWTTDLSVESSYIEIFRRIRDIPFIIMPAFFDIADGPAEMLKQNKGFCVPKHYLLGFMYQRLGIRVKYCVYPFKWHELDINYPQVLRDMALQLPITYHLACKAFIGDKWVLVDATWDSSLKRAGFPVNEFWDGKANTLVAVRALNEFVYENPYASEALFSGKINGYSFSEKLRLFRFSDTFNKWLQNIRIL